MQLVSKESRGNTQGKGGSVAAVCFEPRMKPYYQGSLFLDISMAGEPLLDLSWGLANS